MFTNDAARHHHKFEAAIAARDPLLDPPLSGGGRRKRFLRASTKELGMAGLLFLPLKRGRIGGGLLT
jgi:hypothetical protein